MPRILIRSLEQAPVEERLDLALTRTGCELHAVIAGDDDPLHLHRLLLAAGGTVAWRDGGRGLMLYVKSGSVEVEGQVIDSGGSITIEHGAAARLEARAQTELLIFGQGPSGSARVTGPGGHIHLLPPSAVPRRSHYAGYEHIGGALFADASCPTCSLWLHENTFWGNHGADLHTHSEDEIIVVLAGEVILGRRSYAPGTVIAVAAHTVYGFATGSDRTRIINFRPASPTYQSRKNKLGSIDEREFNVRQLGSPAPLSLHRPSSSAA